MTFTDDTAPCSSMQSLTMTSAKSTTTPLTLIAGMAPDRFDTAVADTVGVALGPDGAVAGFGTAGGCATGVGAAGGCAAGVGATGVGAAGVGAAGVGAVGGC